jgi:hypothetical protein
VQKDICQRVCTPWQIEKQSGTGHILSAVTDERGKKD